MLRSSYCHLQLLQISIAEVAPFRELTKILGLQHSFSFMPLLAVQTVTEEMFYAKLAVFNEMHCNWGLYRRANQLSKAWDQKKSKKNDEELCFHLASITFKKNSVDKCTYKFM